MPMAVIVTRDVEDRYRGFLLSCMPEVAPGIYVAPNLSKGVRDRIWDVLSDWHSELQRGSVTMAYAESAEPSGLRVRSVGTPRKVLVDFDGFFGVRLQAERVP